MRKEASASASRNPWNATPAVCSAPAEAEEPLTVGQCRSRNIASGPNLQTSPREVFMADENLNVIRVKDTITVGRIFSGTIHLPEYDVESFCLALNQGKLRTDRQDDGTYKVFQENGTLVATLNKPKAKLFEDKWWPMEDELTAQ